MFHWDEYIWFMLDQYVETSFGGKIFTFIYCSIQETDTLILDLPLNQINSKYLKKIHTKLFKRYNNYKNYRQKRHKSRLHNYFKIIHPSYTENSSYQASDLHSQPLNQPTKQYKTNTKQKKNNVHYPVTPHINKLQFFNRNMALTCLSLCKMTSQYNTYLHKMLFGIIDMVRPCWTSVIHRILDISQLSRGKNTSFSRTICWQLENSHIVSNM